MLHSVIKYSEVFSEAIAIALTVVIALIIAKNNCWSFYALERRFGRIGRMRGLSVTLVGLLALGASATLSLLGRIPEPEIHDEFSYLF